MRVPLIKAGSYFNHRYRWGLLLLGVVLILFVINGLLGKDSDADATITTTATVVRGDIENLVTATGTLQPKDYVDVGAQVSGQLKVLHVEVGDEVKKGDLLAEIDATVYLAKVDGSRAQLRNQRAQLLDREAQLKLAQINATRQKNLYKEDATTRESLDSAEASLQSAKAQIAALKAQIEQIESSLRAEEANLEFASIYAPMFGTVVTIDARQGQTLNTNQTAPILMRIADLSVMTVEAQVSEADIGKLRAGTRVYFTTLGGEGRRWYSKLDRIEPTPTVLNNVVLYNALFDVPNPNGLLMTQMTTQVFFITAEAKNALLVPVSALSYNVQPARRNGLDKTNLPNAKEMEKNLAETSSSDQSQSAQRKQLPDNTTTEAVKDRQKMPRKAQVNLIDADGNVQVREVIVGVTNRVQAEIISGLAEGDQVITGIQQQASKQKSDSGPRGFGPRMMR